MISPVLKETSVLIQDENIPLSIVLDDTDGTAMTSSGIISFVATQGITIEGKNILFAAKGEGETEPTLTLAKAPMYYAAGEDDESVEIVLGEACSILYAVFEGQEYLLVCAKGNTLIAGQVFNSCDPIEDAPVEGTFDTKKFIGNLLGGLAIVAVGTLVVAARTPILLHAEYRILPAEKPFGSCAMREQTRCCLDYLLPDNRFQELALTRRQINLPMEHITLTIQAL